MDRPLLGAILVLQLLCAPVYAGIVTSFHWLEGVSGVVPAGELPDSFGIDSSRGIFLSESNTQIVSQLDAAFQVTETSGSLGFRISEGVFDTSAGLPQMLADIDVSGSQLGLEADGASQGDAESAALGFDSLDTFKTSLNALLIMDFSFSSAPVFTFAADLLDFEGGNGRDAYLGVYDLDGGRVFQQALGVTELGSLFGNDEVVSFMVQSNDQQGLGAIALAVGDDDAGSTGGYERLAIADFYLEGGASNTTVVPLPAAAPMLLAGLALLSGVAAARRRLAA